MKNKNLRISGIFKILSSAVRLRILHFISEHPRTVKQIRIELRMSSQNISQHLRYLRARGIVGYKIKENKHIYFLKKKRLLEVIKLVKSIFTR